MAKVSFSQYSMWSTCKHQYKLNYIDKVGEYESNINLIFGTAMHSTLQKFLDVMYNGTKSAAMEMDLDRILMQSLSETFAKEKEGMKEGTFPCTKEELMEYYDDGRKILKYFKNHLPSFFSKKGYELVGIEIPLNFTIREGIHFIGFIDVVIRDLSDKSINIIDFKTSTAGWSKYQKSDPVKNSQLLLYKKFYAEKFNISEDKVKVEFHILKRKLMEATDYTIPRISRHIPANGKPSINKAWNAFMQFVDDVFDEKGEHKMDNPYTPTKGKHCDWCAFKDSGLCPAWPKFF
jgi:PD-(D/E)XK nuclease superfamily